MPAPQLKQPALRVVRISGAALNEGVDSVEMDGVRVPVFNAAKTVADCFKYRNKVDLDVALEALSHAWRKRRVTMDELWHYATIDRVRTLIRLPVTDAQGTSART